MIHKHLKSWGAIAKAKNHDSGFKNAKGSDACSLPLIFLPDVDVVVSPSDIKLGEESRVLHVINQLRDEGERVPIVNGVAVKVAIILTGMKKNGVACGDLEGTIHLVFRCSLMKALQASCLAGLRGWNLAILGTKESFSLMMWLKD